MAMDQSALLDLLGELKLTDVTDRIRLATETGHRFTLFVTNCLHAD